MKAIVVVSLICVLTLLGSCAIRIGPAAASSQLASEPRDLVSKGSSPVFYNLQLTIRDGQQEAFTNLMEEMVTATKQESGTLVYEWYLAADGKTCHIHEMFADTAAYQVHSANFGAKFATRFMPLLVITGLTAYGNSDSEAREKMSSLQPVFFEALGGFRR